MSGDHHVFRQLIGLDHRYQLLRRVPYQAFRCPFILITRNLIAHTHLIAVPAASRVRQIEYIAKIRIHIGFTDDTQITVVVFLPKIFSVPFAGRRPVHANSLYRIVLTEVLQPNLKMIVRFIHISITQTHILVMIPYLVSQLSNSAYHFRLVALRDDAEIITRLRPYRMLYLRGLQTIRRLQIHIVPQDNELRLSIFDFRFSIIRIGDQLVSLALQRLQQLPIYVQRKVPHYRSARMGFSKKSLYARRIPSSNSVL